MKHLYHYRDRTNEKGWKSNGKRIHCNWSKRTIWYVMCDGESIDHARHDISSDCVTALVAVAHSTLSTDLSTLFEQSTNLLGIRMAFCNTYRLCLTLTTRSCASLRGGELSTRTDLGCIRILMNSALGIMFCSCVQIIYHCLMMR